MPKHYEGSCHCGAVQFRLEADIKIGVVCDCSICIRKSAIMALIDNDSFTLITGQDALSVYQFNSFQAIHYFCSHCGIYTHHKRRSGEGLAVNTGCLTSFDKTQLAEITHFSGASLSVVK